jgi:hydrogenase maturation protease
VARTLLLGLGNELLRDDGVGLAAARRVSERVGDRADLAQACVANLDLLPIVRGYDRVVVVDAYVSATDPAGARVRATPEDLPRRFGHRSFHTLPFRELLDLGRAAGWPMPREISIHGLCVEEASTFGESFTPAVEQAWRTWADEIAREEFGVGPGASTDRG